MEQDVMLLEQETTVLNFIEFDKELFLKQAGEEEKDFKVLLRLLRKMFHLWNLRISSKLYNRALLIEFLTILVRYGIPYKQGEDFHRLSITQAFNYKFCPILSMPKFFEAISDLEFRIRRAVTFSKAYGNQGMMVTGSHGPYWGEFIAARQLNALSLAVNFGSHPMFESPTFAFKLGGNLARYRVLVPFVVRYALQVYIMRKDKMLLSDDVLINISKFVTKSSGVRSFENDSISSLTEILLTAIATGASQSTISEIVRCYSRFNREALKQEKHEYCFIWKTALILNEFEQCRRSGFDRNHRMKDIAKHAMDHFNLWDDNSTKSDISHFYVLIDIALRIYLKLGEIAEIYDLIPSAVARCPRFVPRVIQLLRAHDDNDDYSDVIDELVEQGCHPRPTANQNDQNQSDTFPPAVHESDPIWLDSVSQRLKNPSRFGPDDEVRIGCVKSLFAFLDYGSNRTSKRAWKLMAKALQTVPPESVIEPWRERHDWWPRFHNVPLSSKHAEGYRSAVLSSLHVQCNI